VFPPTRRHISKERWALPLALHAVAPPISPTPVPNKTTASLILSYTPLAAGEFSGSLKCVADFVVKRLMRATRPLKVPRSSRNVMIMLDTSGFMTSP